MDNGKAGNCRSPNFDLEEGMDRKVEGYGRCGTHLTAAAAAGRIHLRHRSKVAGADLSVVGMAVDMRRFSTLCLRPRSHRHFGGGGCECGSESGDQMGTPSPWCLRRSGDQQNGAFDGSCRCLLQWNELSSFPFNFCG